MERAVLLFAVIQFAVIGISHTLQPRSWVRFFLLLHEKGHAGVFATAFLSLWFGSIIVAFHPVWSGIPAVVTAIGWAQVLKGFLYFVFPDLGLRKIGSVSEDKTSGFVAAGVVFLFIAVLVAYHLASTN